MGSTTERYSVTSRRKIPRYPQDIPSEPVETTCTVVSKYRRTGSVVDRPRLRPPRELSDDCYVLIDNLLSENDELTTRMLLLRLKENDPQLNVSLSTVKRARQELRWVSTMPRYCQFIREANKEKRLKWSEEQIANNEKFDYVIFTDECSAQLDVHRRKCYRNKKQLRKLKPWPNHPPKFMYGVEFPKKERLPLTSLEGSQMLLAWLKYLMQG